MVLWRLGSLWVDLPDDQFVVLPAHQERLGLAELSSAGGSWRVAGWPKAAEDALRG